MRIKITVLFITIIVLFFTALLAQKNYDRSDQKFKIVYVADPRVVNNKDWLNKITKDWGATGICIRIFWGHIDIDSVPGADNWLNLNNAINTLISFKNKKLDIYLRICMGLQKPIWVSPFNYRFTEDDFQTRYDNTIYDHQRYEEGIPESEKYPLNFNSPNSQRKMKNFVKEVLEHIDKVFTDSVKSRIKEVVPTFSTSDEEEYPFSAMCGYSSYENEDFITYLKNKYLNNLPSLNNKWNPENDLKDFDIWSEISPAKYRWHTYNNSVYKYPNGRIDWISFRTKKLANFIDSLYDLIASYNFQAGVQLGSIYDNLIEKRGWIDPTILFEKANAIHVADIYQYSENFDFGAEYLNSICKFWTETNKWFCQPVRFSTETNWPSFNNKDPDFLSFYWKKQLLSYYNNGASEHYLVGWDVAPQKLDSLKSSYAVWRNILLNYSNKEVVKKDNKVAVHLGVEQVFYNHNNKSFWNKTFELNNYILSQYESISQDNSLRGGKDIITNYMLERNPDILLKYNSVYFGEDDGFISEKAYSGLTHFLKEESIIKTNLGEIINMDDKQVWYKNEYNEDHKIFPKIIRLKRD
jgi:hypothetical protein